MHSLLLSCAQLQAAALSITLWLLLYFIPCLHASFRKQQQTNKKIQAHTHTHIDLKLIHVFKLCLNTLLGHSSSARGSHSYCCSCCCRSRCCCCCCYWWCFRRCCRCCCCSYFCCCCCCCVRYKQSKKSERKNCRPSRLAFFSASASAVVPHAALRCSVATFTADASTLTNYSKKNNWRAHVTAPHHMTALHDWQFGTEGACELIGPNEPTERTNERRTKGESRKHTNDARVGERGSPLFVSVCVCVWMDEWKCQCLCVRVWVCVCKTEDVPLLPPLQLQKL